MKFILIPICFGLTICMNLFGQSDTMKMFIFGHSLIDHRPPINPTPSDETTVPHWLYLLSQEANKNYAGGGQYGFLPQHANVPPISQWGYDIVPGVWESDTEAFADADINTIMITAGNFIQWQAPDEEYYSDPGITPISATETIIDWLGQQEDSLRIYIYENWPDMAGFLNNGFPPSETEFDSYNAETNGAFHDWWISYHDALLLSRPDENIKMIPVGPIMSKLHTDLLPLAIPTTELYEDDAPHGRATTYFLAGLITYMAVNEQKAPSSYNVPTIVHSAIQNNYVDIVDFIWAELLDFNDDNGESRVFFSDISAQTDLELSALDLTLYPNPTQGLFQISGALSEYIIDILDANGNVYQSLDVNQSTLTIDINGLPAGTYFLRVRHQNYGSMSVEKILKLN